MPQVEPMSAERLAEIEATYRPINGQGEWADAHRVINQLLAEVKRLRGENEDRIKQLRTQTEIDHRANVEWRQHCERQAVDIAELRKDAARLDWLCQSEAYMAHSRDGDDCHLVWPFNSFDEEDGSTKIQGGNFGSHRASIDAAMAVRDGH